MFSPARVRWRSMASTGASNQETRSSSRDTPGTRLPLWRRCDSFAVAPRLMLMRTRILPEFKLRRAIGVPWLVMLIALAWATALRADENPVAPGPLKPSAHVVKTMEGWSVRVDDRLAGPEPSLAEKMLDARLLELAQVVPEPALSALRKVTIQLDLTHGELHSMQYHPSAGWLREHGYAEELARCVHIPEAARFISPFEIHRQPWAVLHELAHAYHDQVLGFDEPRVRAAFEKFRDSGKHASTLTVGGGKQPHYALTNEREFFAEMTECYFGTNDFYPFVSGELKQAEPELFALLQEIWGSLPRQ